jgi:hypothetical protein
VFHLYLAFQPGAHNAVSHRDHGGLNNFVRLNSDRSIDGAFPLNVTIDGGWTAPQLALFGDGTALVLVGGTFTSVSSVPRNALARLFLDGSSEPGVQFPTMSCTGWLSNCRLA